MFSDTLKALVCQKKIYKIYAINDTCKERQ